MKVTCKYCGIVDKPHKCTHKVREDNRRKDKKIYRGGLYKEARSIALETYNYVDLWELYVNGGYQQATITHHIVEVMDDASKANEWENLYPTAQENHEHIHRLYRDNKVIIQRLLYSMCKDYINGDKQKNKYKDDIDRLKGAKVIR